MDWAIYTQGDLRVDVYVHEHFGKVQHFANSIKIEILLCTYIVFGIYMYMYNV